MKVNLKVMLKQKSNHFIVQNLSKHSLKASAWWAKCENVQQFYFKRKRQRTSTKNARKTCYWNLIFVIYSYSTWARRQLKHARHVDTWARKVCNIADSILSVSDEVVIFIEKIIQLNKIEICVTLSASSKR